MSKKMDIKPMTHCFIPGCAAIAEWNKLLFFKMSFGDLPHWWRSTAWVAKHKTELPADALICERHFEERFIDRSRKKPRLLVGTIPTMNLTALEVDSQENLEFFCRMCAKKGFAPMRYRLEQLAGMSEVVRCCLGRYRTDEGLPPGVCESCVQMVKRFAQFVKQCEESQRQMLQVQGKGEEEQGEERSQDSAEYAANVEANKENTDAEERENPEGQSSDKASKNGNSRKRKSKCFDDAKPCPDCGKLFKTQGRYYYHLQSHNEREYVCQICGKNFARKDGLRKHLELVHGGKVRHKCAHCGQIFSTRSQLNHHRTEEHNVKIRVKTENAKPSPSPEKSAKREILVDDKVD